MQAPMWPAAAQVWQAAAQSVAQQNPSAQNPDRQSPAALQEWPIGSVPVGRLSRGASDWVSLTEASLLTVSLGPASLGLPAAPLHPDARPRAASPTTARTSPRAKVHRPITMKRAYREVSGRPEIGSWRERAARGAFTAPSSLPFGCLPSMCFPARSRALPPEEAGVLEQCPRYRALRPVPARAGRLSLSLAHHGARLSSSGAPCERFLSYAFRRDSVAVALSLPILPQRRKKTRDSICARSGLA